MPFFLRVLNFLPAGYRRLCCVYDQSRYFCRISYSKVARGIFLNSSVHMREGEEERFGEESIKANLNADSGCEC